MAGRWVIDGSNGWLTLRALRVDWAAEAEIAGYDGPVAGRMPRGPRAELRWMLHPSVGLPSRPFTVWRTTHPGGNLSAQQLADLDGWEPVKLVGLPVDESWTDTPYSHEDQGRLDDPRPPVEAALLRLEEDAPPIGWTTLTVDGVSLPAWEPVEIDRYLDGIREGRLLGGVHDLLRRTGSPSEHDAFVTTGPTGRGGAALPQLVLGGGVGTIGEREAASASWRPLRLLALAAGTDPYAALALGYGTSLELHRDDDPLVMVSVVHQLDPAGPEFELAAVVRLRDGTARPAAPRGLRAARSGRTPPQTLDGPALDSIAVQWDPPPNAAYLPFGSAEADPAGYAVGRIGPDPAGHMLNTPRPAEVRGWLPYVASRSAEARPATFHDHVVRTARTATPPFVIADPFTRPVTYAAAAQDLFGRWSAWATATATLPGEEAPVPRVLGVTLARNGAITADFSWDWTDRSPQFVELSGAYVGDAAPAWAARVEFAGADEPEPGPFDLTPLDQGLKAATSFGTPQDRDGVGPGVRYYRLATTIPLDFSGAASRTIEVAARGQSRLHHAQIPSFNIGPFGAPSAATVVEDTPPDAPRVPEAPQWASLPDWQGVSRASLTWQPVARAAGYVVYEATETALLSMLFGRSPDTAEPFTDRLSVLRAADLRGPRVRDLFRRVQTNLVPPSRAAGFEVTLPRGSRVLHLYAVTAVSENGAESAWPDSSASFIAVAVPRLDVPAAPVLEAHAGAGTVRLRVDSGTPAPAGGIELYRAPGDGAPPRLDDMGAPFASLLPTEAVTETDDGSAPRWRRVWYRAVAWSGRDDRRGLVETRSPSSAPVSVLTIPTTAPSVSDVRVNEPGSTDAEALVSWATSAPRAPTPLGGHRVVVEPRDGTAGPMSPLRGTLDQLPVVAASTLIPPAGADAPRLVRVHGAAGERICAWLPRPAVDSGMTVELKVIDPLGRFGRATAVVPPMPPPPAQPPVVVAVEPASGHAGDVFTIFGANLVLHPADDVAVLFLDLAEPFAELAVRAAVVQPTRPDAVTVRVPSIGSTHDHVDARVTLVRRDGAEVVASESFFVAIL